jgi:type IV pilus assembly protein PilW
MINNKQSYGFSLVELLVAMVVGLIIVTGVFSLHSATRKTQVSNEVQMDMVADARFAIELISYDLRHAGMWGGTNKDGLIECKSSDAPCTGTSVPVTAAGDCAVGQYFNLTLPVFATDGTAGNPYSATCIPGSEKYVANTDVLEIRYADSNYEDPITGLEKTLSTGQSYVRSNFVSGRVFTGAIAPELSSHESSPQTHNYVLHSFTYYVSDYTDTVGDGVPSLRRVALVKGPAMQNQTLVSGVADLQVQFGVDADGIEDANGNLAIDRYVNPDAVTDWTAVYAAKIWLLMRSDKKQLGVDTAKSFSIAGAAATTYGGQDDYRYFLVTSVVNLRNLKQL